MMQGENKAVFRRLQTDQTGANQGAKTHMIRRLLDRLYLFSGYLAGLFLIAIFVLMMLLSAGRPLGINIPAGDDFISWCMAATAFLGLAHTFRHGEMIRVGLLIDRLSDGARHYIEIAALLIDPSERARALRQATPFAGTLEPRERWKLWSDVRREWESK